MALVGSVSGSSTYNSRIGITGSVVFAGADVDYGASFPTIGNDVAFYVSGSSGGKDSATDRGVSVFGGDVHISGSITSDNTSLVDISGTPANNQLAVWTNASTVEGDADLTVTAFKRYSLS